LRWEPAWRHLDQTRPSQRDRDLAFRPCPGLLILRRAAAWRAFLRPVFLQRGDPDRRGRPLGLRRPTAPTRRHGREAGCDLKGGEPVEPFETLDKRFAPYTIPIVFLEKLHTGLRWAEGPVYFADQRCLLFSDLP